jgi:hypothetical protein
MRRRSLLGLFARSSRSESEHTARKETAAKVGAGMLGAAALAALFLGVRHYRSNTATSLLAILRDVTIDEEAKRKALLAASPEDRARVLADLPAFATLVTLCDSSTITQICDALCLVPSSAYGITEKRVRDLLGCGECCNTPATTDENPELVQRVRADDNGAGSALAFVLACNNCKAARKRVLGAILVDPTTIQALVVLRKGDRTRLMAISQFQAQREASSTSVDEIDAIEAIESTQFTVDGDKDAALKAYTRLVLDGQDILAAYMLSVINPRTNSSWPATYTYPPMSVQIPDDATIEQRVRVLSSKHAGITWAGTDTTQLQARMSLSGLDKLRALCLTNGSDVRSALDQKYTPAEYMLICREVWRNLKLRWAVYNSDTFLHALESAYPPGWFTVLGYLCDASDYTLKYTTMLASVQLNDTSARALRKVFEVEAKPPSSHAKRVWKHVQGLVPTSDAPTPILLDMLGFGIERGFELEKDKKALLAATVTRWPISDKGTGSICSVLGALTLSKTDDAGAIIECAIRAESGGFTRIASAMCTLGKAALAEKTATKLKQRTSDLVHLAIASRDSSCIAAIRADPKLLRILAGKARRNEAGYPSQFALEATKAPHFGTLYTE